MIGLVVVSHSAKLAEGVRELAEQMTQNTVPIAAAGGIDDPENPIGTDAMQVMAAIESVYSVDGVVVLMDLGSAIMSAEMAIEFLMPEQQPNVYLCEAPLAEGTLAAAVQIKAGGDVNLVMDEARAALAPKQKQLAGASKNSTPPSETAPPDAADGETLTITVPNKLGLHARPAARLVSLAGQFDAKLTVKRGAETVNARSITQVNTLGARHGDTLTFMAHGTDAADALKAVKALVDDNFGDQDGTPNGTAPAADRPTIAEDIPENVIVGIPASDGIAIGTARHLQAQMPEIEMRTVADANAERTRLATALTAAVDDLKTVATETKRKVGADEAGIFEAHQLILQDPDLTDVANNTIDHNRQNAEAAWWSAVEAMADRYRNIEDAYMQARAADVLDVGRRVLRHLTPGQPAAFTFDKPCILLAKDLSPSDTAQLDPENVLGIITAEGGATGHSAIIARGLGIPAVVGAGAGVQIISEGAKIALDGKQGYVWQSPNAAQLTELRTQRDTWQQQQRELRENSRKPAITTDGTVIEVAANIGTPKQSAGLLDAGAEGIGLFRTELLFMDRAQAPTEDEQFEAYTQAAKALDGGPVIIRTLDVGGDKPISYITFDHEENPFLGHRGIRYWLENTDLAKTQLRAACRTSAAHNIKLMFPMVGTLDEVKRARALLEDVQAELKSENIAYDAQMEVGIMVEVPAAVMNAAQLARHVDFFSVGTNDLTQYIMAADRGNPKVKGLVSPFQPAVLHALRRVTDAAKAAGIWTGMCGEMAGNPLATELLVGLGFNELSMNAPAIAEVKAKIRAVDSVKAREIATHALTLESATAVKTYLSQ
ncbi:MAG: phosphoenolpyruvate--protein phosphotransferase [Chloroflexota bacterium]